MVYENSIAGTPHMIAIIGGPCLQIFTYYCDNSPIRASCIWGLEEENIIIVPHREPLYSAVLKRKHFIFCCFFKCVVHITKFLISSTFTCHNLKPYYLLTWTENVLSAWHVYETVYWILAITWWHATSVGHCFSNAMTAVLYVERTLWTQCESSTHKTTFLPFIHCAK